MLNIFRFGVIWAFSSALFPSSIAQATINTGQSIINIDTFVDAPGFLNIGPEEIRSETLTLSGFDPANVIGGEKELFIDGEAYFIDSAISVNNERVSIANSGGEAGYRWGENSSLNLNISSGTFDLTLSEIQGIFDGGSFEIDFSLVLISERNTLDETIETIVRSLTAKAATDVTLSWDANDFPQINFADLDSIAIEVAADPFLTNIYFDNFTLTATVVPEPFSGTLMASFLVLSQCFGFQRRK